jgi:hypothetical protein
MKHHYLLVGRSPRHEKVPYLIKGQEKRSGVRSFQAHYDISGRLGLGLGYSRQKLCHEAYHLRHLLRQALDPVRQKQLLAGRWLRCSGGRRRLASLADCGRHAGGGYDWHGWSRCSGSRRTRGNLSGIERHACRGSCCDRNRIRCRGCTSVGVYQQYSARIKECSRVLIDTRQSSISYET